MDDYLPAELLELYEVYSYRHAVEVLATGCPTEFSIPAAGNHAKIWGQHHLDG